MREQGDNRSSEVSDVKKSRQSGGVVKLKKEEPRVDMARVQAYLSPERNNEAHLPRRPHARISRIFLWSFIVVFLVAASLAGYGAWWFRTHVSGTVDDTLHSVIDGTRNLQNMDFQAAADNFSDANRSLTSPGASSAMDLVRYFGNFLPALKGFANSFGQLQNITRTAEELALKIKEAESELPQAFFSGDGQKVLAIIDSLHDKLKSLRDSGSMLVSATDMLPSGVIKQNSVPQSFLLETDRYIKDLEDVRSWLAAPEGRRLAVLFGNTSELRPGGGFTGSYAEVLIKNGAMQDIVFHDINDPDRLLNDKILPPVPVRMIASRFRAADANWFLDFPKSAEKTLSLMERSQLYASSGVKFDGVIGVTPQLISQLLAVTGPLKINGKEFNSSNFIFEIQKNVQDSLTVGNKDPKGVLRELLAQILPVLRNLPQDKRGVLFAALPDLAANKDVQIYLRNDRFENLVKSYGAAGEVRVLESGFAGSYFALAIANLGGQKTDIVMKTTVNYQASIGADGKITVSAGLTREHNGKKQTEWWYREPNIAYVRMYAPADAAVSEVSGIGKPRTTARVFDKTYLIDPDVQAVESTRREFVALPNLEQFDEYGRSSFGFWQKVALGQSQESVIDYAHPSPAPTEGQTYTFVIERQAGLTASWNIQISAPVGWHFKENGLPMYELQTDELPGRMEATLTLTRAQ